MYDETEEGDILEIDFSTGKIFNATKNRRYQAQPFPLFIADIISKGGLLNSLQGRELHE
ncbi:Methanogen homoaconitase small subunit [bioreactor metagenome]|uniref:Methanogen homoaconitase small subunit n=1 Tax=bioreactor metagenome TaxID=1076179 RepID=A0A645JET7_9ZZZZ